MRVSAILSVLILITFIGLTWKEKENFENLQSEQQILLKEARKMGIYLTSGKRSQQRQKPNTSRSPIDPALFAEEMIQYTIELKDLAGYRQYPSDEILQRIIMQMDKLNSLKVDELRQTIEHIAIATRHDEYLRRRLATNLITKLTERDPSIVLDCLLDRDMRIFLYQYRNKKDDCVYVNKALRALATKNPVAALAWHHKHIDVFSELQTRRNAQSVKDLRE